MIDLYAPTPLAFAPADLGVYCYVRAFYCDRSAIREFDRRTIKIPQYLLRDTDPLEMMIRDKLRFHRSAVNYLQEELYMHRLLTYGES